MSQKETVLHTLEPWYDASSRVLILGTMPSPKSRQYQCYYGHPQNRFWKTMAAIFEEPVPTDVYERRRFITRHHMALWDVLASCEIHGADDASIAAPVANNIAMILEQCRIRRIYTTGKKAKSLYDTLVYPHTKIEAYALPSTSPANIRWFPDDALIQAYQVIKADL